VKSRSEILKDLKALLRRVQEGDEEAVPRLREILDATPTLARRFVDPAVQVERSMIQTYAGDDLRVKETMPRTLRALRNELAGADPSPLEQILVERVVATWFQLQYFETLYAQNMKELTNTQSEYHQKRLDHAHRRHLSAIKTLAQIRKLGPAVQINIADKQINTAG
jgi:hypothetical protein